MELLFEFDPDKNTHLKTNRGISFEEIISLIDEGNVLEVIEHTSKVKYPNQKIYVIDVAGYVYLVPFVRNKNTIFLKTIYPSRKATRDYLKK